MTEIKPAPWTADGRLLLRDGDPVGTLESAGLAIWVAEACETLAEMEAATAVYEASGEAPICAMVDIGGEQMRIQGGADMPEPLREAMAEVVGAARRKLVEDKAAERAEILRDAARDLLAWGFHSGGCSGSPHADGSPLPDTAPKPGECMCSLGRHYRWLIKRADQTMKEG